MVVSVNIVLEIYASLLNGSLSYSDADRWAWKIMQLFDDGKVEFEPKEKEEFIWQLIQYLHGIDMPSVSDRTKTMISDLDIIDFLKLPYSDEYRPHFVIYALWKPDVKDCVNAPFLMTQLYNNKGLQFNIPYLKHSVFISAAINCFKKQFPISLNGNTNLKSLFDFVDNRFNDLLIKSNSAAQAKLFELKFYSALYVGNQAQIQNVLNQIQQASKNWNMQMFETWYGKFDNWIRSLQSSITNREEFLKQIEANKQNKKIAKLQSSELTA